MAGQGITVSILAKIEGWQELIKLIQNAMKNIKPGSDMSKSLMKDLQQVENMVNNLGKNMTLRFTSDSQITHFVDKMMDVERVFDRIGTSMQHVSFGDINPDYIASNFKDLLSTLEKANDTLGTGMQNSFLNAISGSKELLKEFEKMKLDPKNMNIDLVRDALKARGDSLAKEMLNAQAEVGKLKQKMDDARAARDELLARKTFISDDPNARAMLILGGLLPTNGTLLDLKAIDDKLLTIRSTFMNMGMTEADLNRILPSVDKLMQAAKWDLIPDKLANYIREAGIKNDNRLFAAQGKFNVAKEDYLKYTLGPVNRLSADVYSNTQAQSALEAQIAVIVEKETAQLRMLVEQLKAQLEGRATEGIRNTGSGISGASALGLLEAASAAEQYSAALERVKAGEQMVGKIQGVIQRWFSVYAVVRMVTNAVKKAAKNIQELDATMTEIAIVTKMDLGDLWKLMPKYTKMAREYASSIKGVYEVSLIYYQLGLEMNDVMSLTESTLKMARISGLGYSEAADYMTNAIRSFKMEMTEAERVVDVYSAVAASSASNVTELATAMSKTASSALAVGSSFENTTAMLAVMIEATRESPENIGSAMKSIISRYGELKENKTGIDEEGEEYSLNKVDKALLTVGISIHDAKGEFRDFDDVIFELSEHWNEIDKNTLRYIATVMAGNRQQSRFLALVSSSDRLKEESAKATNSEDAAQLQFLKSLDSIDAKKQLLETSILSIYTNSGIELIYKDMLDFTNRILISFDLLSSTLGLGSSIAKISTTFLTLSTTITSAFKMIKQSMMVSTSELTAKMKAEALALELGFKNSAEALKAIDNEKTNAQILNRQKVADFEKAQNEKSTAAALKKLLVKLNLKVGGAMALSTLGMTLSTIAALKNVEEERLSKAWLTGIGGALSGIGTGLLIGGPVGMAVGAISAIPSIIEAIGMSVETEAERIAKVKSKLTDVSNNEIKSKDEYKSLKEYKEKLEQLKDAQYDSAEAKKAYLDASNEMADKYPELISYIDEEGNKIVDLTGKYKDLEKERAKKYLRDLIEAGAENINAANDKGYRISEMGLNIPSKKESFSEKYLGWINGFNFIDSNGLVGLSNVSYNKIAEDLLRGYNFGISFSNHGKYDNTDTKDFLEAVFGTSYSFKNETGIGFTTNLRKGLATANLNGNENFNLKYALENLEGKDVYLRLGYFIEGLIDAGKTLEEINPILSTVFNGKAISFDEQLFNYRKLIKDSEEYINKYGEDAIKTANLNLFENTKEMLDIQPESYLENAFMLQNFSDLWESFWKQNKLLYNTKGEAWHAFALNAELNLAAAREAYRNAILSITDTKLRTQIETLFSSLESYSTKEITLLYSQVATEFGKDSLMAQFLFAEKEKLELTLLLSKKDFEASKNNYGAEFKTNITKIVENFNQDFADSILSQYINIFKNKNLSVDTKQDLITDLDQLYETISQITDPIKKASVLSKIKLLDFTSLSELYETADAIESLGLNNIGILIANILRSMSSNVSGNLTTEFNMLSEHIILEINNFNTALSDATKGMDLKKASEMANKLGKKITDFRYADGKYFYDNFNDIEETYLNAEQTLLLDDLTARKELATLAAKTLQIKRVNNTFDINLIDNLSYLKSWEKDITDAGYTILNVLDRNKKFTKERFDIFKTDEEGYLESWASELRGLGFKDIKAFKEMDDHGGELTYARYLKIKDLSRIINPEAQKIELTLAALTEKGETMGIDALIAQYNGNKEAILNVLNDEELFEFDETQGMSLADLKSYISLFLDDTEKTVGTNFGDWLINYLDTLYKETKLETDNYIKDLKARTYLSNGNIEEFLKAADVYKVANYDGGNTLAQALAEADLYNTNLITQIASGNTDNLPEKLLQYAKLIYETFNSVQATVANAMFEAAEGGLTSIWSDEKNLLTLLEFAKKGWIKGQTAETANLMTKDLKYEFDVDKLKLDEDEFKKWVNTTAELTDNEKEAYLEKYFNLKYPNIDESISNFVGKETFSREDIKTHLKNLGRQNQDISRWISYYGLSFNEALGAYEITDYDQYIKQLKIDALKLDIGSKVYNKQLREIDALLRTHTHEKVTKQISAFQDAISNFSKITDDQYTALLESLDDSVWKNISKYLIDLGTGTYKLDIGALRKNLKGFKLDQKVLTAIDNMFASVADEYTKNITTATSLVTKGTTSLTEMMDFVLKFNDAIPDAQADISSLFTYDTNLNLFTLSSKALSQYLVTLLDALKQLGLSGDAITEYINDLTNVLLQLLMDITSILSDTDTKALKTAAKTLATTIQDYLNLGNKVLLHKMDNAAYLTELEKIQGEAEGSDKTGTALAQLVYDFLYGTESTVDEIMQVIYRGGEEGVNALRQLKGSEVTSDEIAAVYNASINRIKEAEEALSSGTGTILLGMAAEIATTSSGIETSTLPDGSVVITAVSSMVDVYANLYLRMKGTAEATTADLNTAFAKVLTAKDQDNIDAIQAFGDAMGMTYESLGNLLAQYGEGLWANLEFVMQHLLTAGIESLGNGQIRITDFEKFSRRMNWEVGGEAYMEAYKAYNDSLIELDRKTSKTIVEEIKSVGEAKTGDKVNVTYLTNAIQGGEKAVNEVLSGLGAEVSKGILEIKSGARIGDIVTALSNLAQANGQAITSELAELADAVESFLDNIVSLLQSGISGSLDNAGANNLREWAKEYANLDLDFTRTADGLRLSELAAIQLYNTLKGIDSIKASLVFDSLSESLQKNNDNFRSTTALMGHIKNISNEVYLNDGKTSPARLKQYEAELEIAKEILAIRSTQEDDSWNFMSNKIPAVQNNPLNFASNWSLALGKIRDAWNLSHVKKAGKTGFMDYIDFYNIVTLMNDMARIGGEIEVGAYKLDGSLESAAKLIEAGASSLTAVDTGEVMVNLGLIGLLLSLGGSELESGITEGVLSIAHAQVEALDGIIAMLELIVSMEQLGDIDVDENGIDLSDLFKVTYDSEGNRTYTEFSEDYKKWVADIKDKINKDSKNYNEDLANAVNGITIEGISLAQILDWKPEDFTNEANASIAKAYTAILDAFTKAALSGNYDLENIQLSVLSVLSESGLDGLVTLDIGDITYVVSAHSVTTIDWKDSDTDAILTNIARLEGREKLEIQKDLTTWILKRGTNELEPQQLIYSLAILKKIVIDDKGNVTSITVAGKDYNTTNSSLAQLDAAVNAVVLEEAGYTVTEKDIEMADPETHAVTVSTKIGNKTIRVQSTDGLVQLLSEDGKREYKNQAEFLEGEYHQWLAENTGKSKEGMYKSLEQWQWGEYRLATEIVPLFTFGDTDEVISPQNNPELRQKLEEIIRGGHDSIEDYFNKNMTDNRDGTYTVNIGGSKFTFTGGDQAAANFEKLITESLGIDLGLKDTIVLGISEAIPSIVESLNSIEATGPSQAASALSSMLSSLQGLEDVSYDTIARNLAKLQFDGFSIYKNKIPQNATSPLTGMADFGGIQSIIQSLSNINSTKVEDAAKAINNIESSHAENAQKALNSISIKGLNVTATANITVLISHGKVGFNPGGGGNAKGNIALAGGTQTLMGELGPELVVSNGRYFLAGQNGAEFVNLEKDAIVFNHKQTERLFSLGAIGSRGKPFTNEQNAISFAKGTGLAKLEGTGQSVPGANPQPEPRWGIDWGYTYAIKTSSGGVEGHLWHAPIAKISLGGASAKGNVKTTGPANASASAALAALKQLRAQWLALEKLTAKDLAGKGGGGGGGGGKDAAFIKDLERWFDLLQEIAKLEQEITYLETLRSKLASDLTPNGSAYAKSQAETLSYLLREVAAAELLSLELEDYFKKRQDALNKQSAFSKLYTFDDEGQIKYASGQFAELSKMFGGNDTTGKPNYSVKQLYNWLISQGYGYAMQYDESGNKIKVKKNDTESMKTAIEAFWAKIESDKQEMQELHDSVEDQKKAVLEKMQEENELLKEIEDNQISVENKVLKAVEDAALREIDKLEDLKNAIEKSNQELIDGLSNALDKERQLYETSESERDLESKRRLLEILRRSGGSASEITSLQAEIDDASRDLYFDKQQELIDAILEASDILIKKLDHLIDLMKESLEYLKEQGLLWGRVAEIMEGNPEEITNYIKENTKEYWGKSPTDLIQSIREDLFEAQQYVAYRDTVTDKLEVVAKLLANLGLDAEWDSFDKMMKEDAGYKQSWNKLTSDLKSSLKTIYSSVLADTGDPNAAARAVWESNLAKELGLTKLQQEIANTPANTLGNKTNTTKTTSKKVANVSYLQKNKSLHLKIYTYTDGSKGTYNENHSFSWVYGATTSGRWDYRCSKCGYVGAVDYRSKGVPEKPQFAEGGMDYVGGEAILHGTKTKPEAVLNATQTKILRDNILSNRPNSLISLLKSYNEGYHGLSSSVYDSITNNSNTTTIEHAEVNVNVAKLANGYDAAKAGDDIMREMLNIARKTNAQNRVGR